MPQFKSGIIYMAFGNAHAEEAKQSIATVRRHMPEVDVTVYTDTRHRFEAASSTIHLSVVYDRAVHIDCLQNAPYDVTLCLDTDTYICESLLPAFGLLERFEVAGVYVDRMDRTAVGIGRIPAEFPTVNAGVLFLRRSARSGAFLDLWKRTYREHQCSPEGLRTDRGTGVVRVQPSLREALYLSDVRMLALPPEYNFRVPGQGYVEGIVKVLHGRVACLPAIARRINQRTDRRFCMTDGKRLQMVPRLRLDRFQRR